MKNICSIGLILCFLVQAFNKSFVYINFKFNQKEIAQTLCVKKEIVENTCQGKCHLKKMMAKQVQEEHKSTERNNPLKEKLDPLFFSSVDTFFTPKLHGTPLNSSKSTLEPNLYSWTFLHKMLKPPISV